MACSARCVVVLMIAVDIQRCRIRFRFADHGYVTVRVDTAVSPRSASLCCSFLIYGCASRARLCRWGIALLIAVDIQRGQKFIRFANHGRYTALVDTAVSSRRALALLVVADTRLGLLYFRFADLLCRRRDIHPSWPAVPDALLLY